MADHQQGWQVLLEPSRCQNVVQTMNQTSGLAIPTLIFVVLLAVMGGMFFFYS